MRRLSHNPIAIVALLALLQFVLLPRQGWVSCAVGASGSSCCTVGTESPCCCCDQDEESDVVAEPLEGEAVGKDDGYRACGCDVTQPEPVLAGSDRDRQEPVAQVASALPSVACPTVGHRITLKVIPRARTGPPLYLAHQVFLI